MVSFPDGFDWWKKLKVTILLDCPFKDEPHNRKVTPFSLKMSLIFLKVDTKAYITERTIECVQDTKKILPSKIIKYYFLNLSTFQNCKRILSRSFILNCNTGKFHKLAQFKKKFTVQRVNFLSACFSFYLLKKL